MHSQVIIKGFRESMQLCIDRIKEISIKMESEDAEKQR